MKNLSFTDKELEFIPLHPQPPLSPRINYWKIAVFFIVFCILGTIINSLL